MDRFSAPVDALNLHPTTTSAVSTAPDVQARVPSPALGSGTLSSVAAAPSAQDSTTFVVPDPRLRVFPTALSASDAVTPQVASAVDSVGVAPVSAVHLLPRSSGHQTPLPGPASATATPNLASQKDIASASQRSATELAVASVFRLPQHPSARSETPHPAPPPAFNAPGATFDVAAVLSPPTVRQDNGEGFCSPSAGVHAPDGSPLVPRVLHSGVAAAPAPPDPGNLNAQPNSASRVNISSASTELLSPVLQQHGVAAASKADTPHSVAARTCALSSDGPGFSLSTTETNSFISDDAHEEGTRHLPRQSPVYPPHVSDDRILELALTNLSSTPIQWM